MPRKTDGIKLGFDRPLQHIRAGAPRCKGARPNLCGRTRATSYTVPFSLFARAFFPVGQYLSPCWSVPFSLLGRTSVSSSRFLAFLNYITVHSSSIRKKFILFT